MRKYLSLAAAAATVFAIGGAQAQTILVDDFNLPGTLDTFSSTTVGSTVTHCYYKAAVAGSTCAAGSNFASSISGVSTATERDIGVTLTQNNSNQNPAMTAAVGGAAGRLNFSASSGDTGSASVAWTLPSGITLPGGSTYFFSVIASTIGAVNTTIGFSFTGASGSFTVAAQNVGQFNFNNPGLPLSYAVAPADAAKIAGGGVLTMNVNGGQGWNLILDQFAFSVPEPTSLALVGLALVGAGVVSRRRKA